MSSYAPLEGAEDVGRDSMQGAGETDRMVADGARGAELRTVVLFEPVLRWKGTRAARRGRAGDG